MMTYTCKRCESRYSAQDSRCPICGSLAVTKPLPDQVGESSIEIMPRRAHRAARLTELHRAIRRHRADGLEVPDSWTVEATELAAELGKPFALPLVERIRNEADLVGEATTVTPSMVLDAADEVLRQFIRNMREEADKEHRPCLADWNAKRASAFRAGFLWAIKALEEGGLY